MSEDQENAVIGRTLKQYQAARRRLAVLHAEAERLGDYLIDAGDALKTRHNLWLGEHAIPSEDVDLNRRPTADHLSDLVKQIKQIFEAQGENRRFAAILGDAGFRQPE